MTYCKRLILVCVVCLFSLLVNAQTQSGLSKDSVSIINTLLDAILQGSTDSSLLLIADISIHGNKKTQPFIIERELPFKQGEYIARNDLEKKLELAKQQVTNTSLFTEVFIYVHSQQGGLVFINVDVKERWYLFPLPYFKLVDRNFNQWWVEQKASLNRVNYGIKFQQFNFSGRNDKLAVNLIAGYSRQVQLKYEQPYAFNSLKSGYSVAFMFSSQRELNYASSLSKQAFFKQDKFVLQTLKTEVAYLYRPAIKTRHNFRFSYVKNQVGDTVVKLNPNYLPGAVKSINYPELSYSIQYAFTDYNAYPIKGFIGEASITRRGITKAMDLTQLQYQANWALPLTKKTNLLLQSAGVLKFPFDQPFINQQLFSYGGPFLRGLEYYVFDGVAGIMGRTTIRKEVFAMQLRTPPGYKKEITIPFRFFVKAGADVGYTYNKLPGDNLLSNKFLYTECLGLDMVIPSYDIVFKFEYSFNQLGEHGIFFHVRTDF